MNPELNMKHRSQAKTQTLIYLVNSITACYLDNTKSNPIWQSWNYSCKHIFFTKSTMQTKDWTQRKLCTNQQSLDQRLLKLRQETCASQKCDVYLNAISCAKMQISPSLKIRFHRNQASSITTQWNHALFSGKSIFS